MKNEQLLPPIAVSFIIVICSVLLLMLLPLQDFWQSTPLRTWQDIMIFQAGPVWTISALARRKIWLVASVISLGVCLLGVFSQVFFAH